MLALAEPPEHWASRLRWSVFRRRHPARAAQAHGARRAARHGALPQVTPLPFRATPLLQLAGTAALTEGRWQQIRQVLPPQQPARGRPRLDHRRMLEAMLWVMRSGRAWRDLPTAFGPWQRVYSRYQRWCHDGLWRQILALLDPDDGDSLFDS